MISGDFLLRSGEILEIGSLPTKSGEWTGITGTADGNRSSWSDLELEMVLFLRVFEERDVSSVDVHFRKWILNRFNETDDNLLRPCPIELCKQI